MTLIWSTNSTAWSLQSVRQATIVYESPICQQNKWFLLGTNTDDANSFFYTFRIFRALAYNKNWALFSASSQHCVLECVVSSSNCEALQCVHPKENLNSIQTSEWMNFPLSFAIDSLYGCARLSSCLLVVVQSSTPGSKFTLRCAESLSEIFAISFCSGFIDSTRSFMEIQTRKTRTTSEGKINDFWEYVKLSSIPRHFVHWLHDEFRWKSMQK